MKLMIVESPNKTKNIDLQTFEPTHQLTERGVQVVSRLNSRFGYVPISRTSHDAVRPQSSPMIWAS